MKNETTKAIKYLLITDRNGLGEERFYAKRVRRFWFNESLTRWVSGYADGFFTPLFHSRDAAMDAIKSDANYRRKKQKLKYKAFVVEPIEA